MRRNKTDSTKNLEEEGSRLVGRSLPLPKLEESGFSESPQSGIGRSSRQEILPQFPPKQVSAENPPDYFVG